MNDRSRRAAAFDALVSDAERLAADAAYEAAAVAASRAAEYAWRCPFGVVAEPRIDAVLRDLGRLIAHSESPRRPADSERVLHVGTKLMGVGGHTRILQRWIEVDAGRRHDLVLTAQLGMEVPSGVSEAVRASGGTVHDIGHLSLLDRASRVSVLAGGHELCVVNQDPSDVVPSLAFSGTPHPPVILVDHADHVFWLGGMVADAVAHLRPRGVALGREHRGLPARTGAIVPIPLDPPSGHGDRSGARRALGVADDEVLLLSVASDYKFRNDAGPHFLDAIEPLLARHKNLKLLAIGPERLGRWQDVVQRNPGRISVPGPQPGIDEALAAADLYVDSYPLPSFTSALQAALHGIPTVVRMTPHGGSAYLEYDDALIGDALTPVESAEKLTALLSEWTVDPERRRRAGAAALSAMGRRSDPRAWHAAIEQSYARASENSGLPQPQPGTVQDVPDALARAVADAHHQGRLDGAFVNVVGRSPDLAVPLKQRARVLYRMRADVPTWRSWARIWIHRVRERFSPRRVRA